MALHDSAAATAQPGGYKAVTVNDVALPANGFTIIDVREPHEFTGPLGHIDGAKLVPLGTLPGAAADWPKDTEYLLVCAGGFRSASAAQQLAKLGFSRLVNLSGGMKAWQAAGLPVAR